MIGGYLCGIAVLGVLCGPVLRVFFLGFAGVGLFVLEVGAEVVVVFLVDFGLEAAEPVVSTGFFDVLPWLEPLAVGALWFHGLLFHTFGGLEGNLPFWVLMGGAFFRTSVGLLCGG